MSEVTVYKSLEEHLGRFFPELEVFPPPPGPALRRVPDLRVLRAPPSSAGKPWVFVTLGAWEATKETGHGREFFVHTPTPSLYHVENLGALVSRHAEDGHEIRLGSVVEIGRPWSEGSSLDHYFVTLPKV